MTFLSPLFLALTALAALPVAIHLLGRPRAERRPFAALAFLARSHRRVAPRNRLRQILLVASRTLIVALVPLLLARPLLEVPSALPAGLGAVESAVVVLDDSRSMGLRAGGSTLFDRARLKALQIVGGLGAGSEAAVLPVSGAEVSSPPELDSDRQVLRQRIATTALTQRAGDTTRALRRAAAILATANHPLRRVYLISDLAAHGFGSDLPWPAGGPQLVPVDVESAAPENLAITRVRTEWAPELGQRGVRIIAEVASSGARPAVGLPVTLRIDGKPVAKGLVDVPPGGRAVKRFTHAFPAPGEPVAAAPVHEAQVEIGGDDLPSDDRRYLVIGEQRRIRVLLIDGDPRVERRADELFYLETALRPGVPGDVRFDVRVGVAEPPGQLPALAGFDVVFLANVRAPDERLAADLLGFVRRGGGLFLSPGGNTDPDAWNTALAPLLPQPLATVRTVGATVDARDDGEVREGGAGERIDSFDARHPVLAPFAGGAHGPAEALREARVARFVLLRPTAGDEGRRVLLRLESGAPLLVEGRCGDGRVLLLTTTVDRDWSDLAIQPAYLPLIQQATYHLAGTAADAPEEASLVGEPRTVELPRELAKAELVLPSGERAPIAADRLAGRRALTVEDTGEPGHYAVVGGDGSVARFAVNVDPRESDLARIDGARLASLGQGAPTAEDGRPATRRVELWHALGLALLWLLLVEGTLASRRP